MSKIEAKLQELGEKLPETSKPLAAYIPSVISGNLVFTSGQLPMVEGKMAQTGKVGEKPGLVTPDQAKALARISALNALAAVKMAIGDLDRITRIVKLVGFVSSDPDFSGQPNVMNGASEFLGEVFGEKGIHARSAVGVAVLPLDASVELELIVEFN